MPQDAFTLLHVCRELNEKFIGGKINKIIQYDEDRISFLIYTGKATEKLNICVNPSSPRIWIGETDYGVPLTALNFCMLLRKHLQNATIKDISLVDFDRIVKIDFLSGGEFFSSNIKTLYIELMGRYSNVILTEQDVVLGANRGINFLDNGVRPLITGKKYVYPPNKDKFLPKSEEFLSYIIDNQSLDVSNLLSKLQGVSTVTAKEIEKQYFLQNKKFSGKSFFEFVNNFLYNEKTSPCVIKKDQTPIDYLAMKYLSLDGEVQYFDSLLKAEDYYFSAKEKARQEKQIKERLLSIINGAINKSKKRLNAINQRRLDAQKCEENKKKGDLILTYVYKINRGDKTLDALDYESGKIIKIELNSDLSPSKNAEIYYKKYNKGKRTLVALEPQIKMATEELDYYLSVLEEIQLAENLEELKLIKEEFIESNLIKPQGRVIKKTSQKPYREYQIDGFTVKVGRNNKENDQISQDARQTDLWLHAKNYHSSHVIIESMGKEIPFFVIEKSAEICAYYSGGRNGGKVEVVYANKKFVKKPKGAKLGFCTYTNYQSIMVNPLNNIEFLKTH